MSQFDFHDGPVSSRKPVRKGLNPVLIMGGVVVVAVVGVGALWLTRATPARLTLDHVDNQTASEGETLKINLAARAEGLKPEEWSYGIVSGPPGARIDPRTGVFNWTPSEDHGSAEYGVTVGVQARGARPAQDKTSFKITVSEVNQAPTIAAIPPQKVTAGETLRVAIKASDADKPEQKLFYRLKSGPEEAKLDGSGVFTWPVSESATTGEQTVEIVVADSETNGAEAIVQFSIQTAPPASPLLRLMAALRKSGLTVETTVGETPPGFTGEVTHLAVGEEYLTILQYTTDTSAAEDAAQVTDAGQRLFGEPAEWKSRTSLFRRDNRIAIYSGSSPPILKAVRESFGEPFVVAEASKVTPPPVQPVERTVPEKLADSLAKLHEQKNLIGKKDYPGVRKLFSDFFESQNEFLLAKLGEGDGADFQKWLNEHTEFKEEFYTAIAPEDDPAAAWKILQAIHRKHPTRLNDYGQLAIATALTWDIEGNVDHYDDHQRRTHSTMPGGLLGAIENFEYFVDAASVMQGRAQFLPWEFQVYMVNHKTPRPEREWAAANYVAKRVMYGKCYADVPYDSEMLRTESRTCKLDGKEYTLPNIKQFGGVCAMQADFAARVGKSIGVPAEYVAGEAAGGELHAWVMWVEVKAVTRTSISFTLESHGRYRGDKYYVGTLRDPQTGKGITDRDLELKLQSVGLNPIAYRHARLVMQMYPLLKEKLDLKPVQEIAFLNDVIEMCPGCEETWRQAASMAREGRIATDSYRQMTGIFDKMFRTFGNFPDFTWKVFDDLVQYQKSNKQRNKYYERLVQMYEASGRPDLACEARLKLSDYLLEDGGTREVIDGLAFTIKKFPDEGRYVPKLLDRLEQVCGTVKGADQQLLRFYLEFIPLIPQKRGNDPSPYCMRMLERAVDKFTAAGQTQQAQAFSLQLANLKASGQ
ncbi:MAG: hypothetical protein JSS49_20540 [Planctomycetes bacterium]|nr:hypothetical protein [Planctomycetota bacterium]